jgi:hypothetical protein
MAIQTGNLIVSRVNCSVRFALAEGNMKSGWWLRDKARRGKCRRGMSPSMLLHELSRYGQVSAALAAPVIAFCLCGQAAIAQGPGAKDAGMPAALLANSSISAAALSESGIRPKAMRLYQRAVRELHGGDAARAEKDALRAVGDDAKFADAEALAATAALSQRQFERGRVDAEDAVRMDKADEKAWVILATADNHLGHYADAEIALSHVRQQDQATWQVAYQWARAEAGQGRAQQTLDWANRAALTAPLDFAPLHLLRASAFLAASQYPQAANELEVYLQLLEPNAPERAPLTRELQQLRNKSKNSDAANAWAAKYNALAN